ncbi:PucR family transcriptional regulator [Paenibacillus mucilaginosus]|uniref:PucR family transcriptional regulator n=1 Tax=Paenibacillus mucilaginosus TaxID=61624 RepID=UPI003D1A249B
MFLVSTLLQLTIREILRRPLFRKAEALASDQALDRVVRWAHILEVSEVGRLLNGGELVLSTGVGWQESEETSLLFLKGLIDSGASGLCIELGRYTKHPLQGMKELALQAHFPLIFFHEEVRYIDITQDLHSVFINRHHRMVSELESLSARLNQSLLAGRGILPLLQLLQITTGASVAFLPIGAEPSFVPPLGRAEEARFTAEWSQGARSRPPEAPPHRTHRPILALDQHFGDLILSSPEELSDYALLALDRTATAVAQEMMRTRYMEEKRRHREDRWLADWLDGKHTEKEVLTGLSTLCAAGRIRSATVCLFDPEPALAAARDFESVLIQKHIVARSIFGGEGFTVLPGWVDRQAVYVLADGMPPGRTPAAERILRCLHLLRKTEPGTGLFHSRAGIGREVTDLTRLRESYETARETAVIQRDTGPLPRPMYSELHVERILALLKGTGQLPALIEDYIGPLIRYDAERSAQLLKTLKVYLAASGSKQETAAALFIVRQTLYHRLEKIATLIGNDFDQPRKRLALELALYAYEYGHGSMK